MHKALQSILEQIEFTKRYETIAQLVSNEDNVKVSTYTRDSAREEVKSALESLKIEFKYDTRERFFAVVDTQSDNFLTQLNILVYEDSIRFVTAVRLDGEYLPLATGVWEGMYNKLKYDDEYGGDFVRMKFYSRNDIELILEHAISIYQDFKDAVVTYYEKGEL